MCLCCCAARSRARTHRRLLLHLREEYERGAAEGSPTVVDHDLLMDHLDVWKQADDQDAATFRKRSENAIIALKDRQILVPVSEGRYRISGIIVPLVYAREDRTC